MSKEKGLLKHIKAYDSNTLNGNLKLMTEIPTYMDVSLTLSHRYLWLDLS